MKTADVVSEALSWVGTPYQHQASLKGLGCDCLGLVRGVWRAVYLHDLPVSQDYAADWNCSEDRQALLAGAQRYFRPCEAGTLLYGRLLIFRWRPHWPARHAGIAVSEDRFVHAYEGGGGVVTSFLVPQWRRRIAGIFAFPNN